MGQSEPPDGFPPFRFRTCCRTSPSDCKVGIRVISHCPAHIAACAGTFLQKSRKPVQLQGSHSSQNSNILCPYPELAVLGGAIFISKRKKTCESSHKSFLSVHLPPNDTSMGANSALLFSKFVLKFILPQAGTMRKMRFPFPQHGFRCRQAFCALSFP